MWKIEPNINLFSQQRHTTITTNNNRQQQPTMWSLCVFHAKVDDTKNKIENRGWSCCKTGFFFFFFFFLWPKAWPYTFVTTTPFKMLHRFSEAWCEYFLRKHHAICSFLMQKQNNKQQQGHLYYVNDKEVLVGFNPARPVYCILEARCFNSSCFTPSRCKRGPFSNNLIQWVWFSMLTRNSIGSGQSTTHPLL